MAGRNKKRLTAYIVMPLVFALCGFLFIYITAKPVLDPVLSVFKMIGSEYRDGTNKEFTDIFEANGTPSEDGSIKASSVTFPRAGTRYGQITIEGTSINAPLFFGDGSRELRSGAGQYTGSSFPGLGGTVLIGAHNNTYFSDLGSARPGAKITLKTNYGVYVYEVTDAAVRRADDTSAFDLRAKQENIVLYTCYPFNMLGLTPQRYFVWGRLVSGPSVLVNE